MDYTGATVKLSNLITAIIGCICPKSQISSSNIHTEVLQEASASCVVPGTENARAAAARTGMQIFFIFVIEKSPFI